MSSSRELRTTFNDVAEIYDEVRPGYPEQLIEDVVKLSGVPPEGSLLEIGCGSGQATLSFARRGYRMLCLELGANLARLAIERCRPYANVEIRNISFEEWPVRRDFSDLVICAEAFHWISPDVRWSKTAAALKREGTVALFWNGHHSVESDLFQAIEGMYRESAPQLAQQRKKSPEELERETVDEIGRSGLFGEVTVMRYPWRTEYSAERYVKLLGTYSSIQGMAEDLRQNLLREVQALIERHSGAVECEYVSRLYVAKVHK